MVKKKADINQKDLFNIQEHLHRCLYLHTRSCESMAANKYMAYRNHQRIAELWFHTDHVCHNGQTFRYHIAQREAIETLIYIYEVKRIRTRKSYLKALHSIQKIYGFPMMILPATVKMATGSGKQSHGIGNCVAIANAIREDETQFAKNFLVLAPNVIVFDRLRSDFESGKIFRTDPLIPKHYQWWWEMEYYMRGDNERINSQGALYLSNIQQFYERGTRSAVQETDVMTAMLGSQPPSTKTEISDFDERIAKREGLLMVLNDEAHHTHDEERME
jgi:type III restriction enzyme